MKAVIKNDGQYIGEHEIVLFKLANRDKVIEKLTEAVGPDISRAEGKNFIECKLEDYDKIVKAWNNLYPNKYLIGRVVSLCKIYYSNPSNVGNSFARIRTLELRPEIKSRGCRSDYRVSYYYYGYMLDIIKVNDKAIHSYSSDVEHETFKYMFNSMKTRGDIRGVNVNDIVLTVGNRRSDITTTDISHVMKRKLDRHYNQ